MSLSFSVTNWAAWGAGLETRDDWLSSQPLVLSDDVNASPNIKDLPMMLRRRLSHLGRMVMRVTHDLEMEDSLPLVFSSRYGESDQTVKLLESLSVKEPLSPTIFSMSVHNGLAGLFSITTRNKQPHTAISAGAASFCNGLLEACAMLQVNPEQPVLLVHYDGPLSDFYENFGDERVKPMALALRLEKTGRDPLSFAAVKNVEADSKEDAALSFMDYLLKNKKSWSWNDGRTQWNSSYAG
ncbi:beta-ketoacyl synthase chain length factor [Terasakiella sp. A23]|uniref:beta-ketoacyl synthase chain length factor n=1 Tax=Terasakiella sp. FCG-A23 TaxID=3080561 RepID=UPI00295323F1|nr:beta-ketoacyl synthase chain length factor [Terasakiella sp. A23]MDV7341019.1 beta-ketoacyl synthase chain length factor [Terasakiella sp. A23]